MVVPQIHLTSFKDLAMLHIGNILGVHLIEIFKRGWHEFANSPVLSLQSISLEKRNAEEQCWIYSYILVPSL